MNRWRRKNRTADGLAAAAVHSCPRLSLVQSVEKLNAYQSLPARHRRVDCSGAVAGCLHRTSSRNWLPPLRKSWQPQRRSCRCRRRKSSCCLIRLSLLTLNDAVQSGNYTVLRDRGGPSFRQANSAAGLSRIFAGLEAQRPDLAAVAIMTPQLTAAEIVGPEQRLHVTGQFPGTVLQIGFDLTYEPADGQWQLFGIAVGAAPPQAQAAAARPRPRKRRLRPLLRQRNSAFHPCNLPRPVPASEWHAVSASRAGCYVASP